MNPGRTNSLVRRLAAALMLSTAPFVAVEHASAACDPPTSAGSPANNTTVTCSGTTVDQNTSGPANFGYGTGTETGITVNVQSGASVTGTPGQFFLQTSGIFVRDGTVNNSGTVTVSTSHGLGIFGLDSITVNNSGNINVDANGQHGDHGVLGNGNVNVTNLATGTIFGFAGGVTAGDDANVFNTGKIEKGGISGTGAGIRAGGNATVTNAVDGTSIGQILGEAFGIDATNATVTNSGVILAGNAQTAGTGIHAENTATVSNTGDGNTTGIISTTKFGIDAGTVIVTANTGEIEGNGFDGRGIRAAGDANVNNAGTIRANSTGGVAIQAGGTATVTNSVNGAVSGSLFGIDATNANIANSGIIGSGVGTAIHATATATVSNTGDGINTGLIAGAVTGIAAGTVNVGSNSGFIFGNASDAITATTGSVNITSNSGTIQSFGLNSAAVSAATDAVVGNTGKILAVVQDGTAINAAGTATVSNSGDGVGTGIISGDQFGINAGTVNVTANTGRISADGVNGVAINGGNVTITNSGLVQATGTIGTGINASGTATVTNTGSIIANGDAIVAATANVTNSGTIEGRGDSFGILATTLDVTNAAGATIFGGAAGITGSGIVRNAGTISGTTISVFFNGATGTNTLILQTGAVLNGDAVGSTAGATNNLVLQGSGVASNNFLNFNTLDVQATGNTWVWTSTGSGSIGATTVSSGTFAVDGTLDSPVAVNAGVLGGRGTVNGDVSVAPGAALAPGAVVPFSTLTVNGNVGFATGSIYRVNINTAGQSDRLATATASLTGGTVNVLAANGFALSMPYTILTASGGLGGTTFSGVTSNFAFLTPSLTYDANNVFLTLDLGNGGGNGFGFAGAAQTRNQRAVAGALDASPLDSPLVTALITQTIDGARQAFDALSGEVFGSLHNAQAEEAQFARAGMLGRMRQMSYAGVPGELGALGFAGPQLAYASGDANAGVPVKAAPGARSPSRDLTFWAQGFGGWGRTDSDGNAASLRSRFGGFLSGADMRFGDTLRAGLVAGYLRSDLNVDARLSSAGIDSAQFGAYAGGRIGAINVRGGASLSFDSIDTSRGIVFPGFSDQAKASFRGNVGQLFGEIGYGMAFNQVAVEPIAGLAYVHVRDNSFLESGGIAALSGTGTHENIGYFWLGVRAATAVPLANGTALIPRGAVQWQYAFGDVTPTTGLAFQSTGAAFSIAGVPIARNSALVEGGLDWRFNPSAKLGAFYQGALAAHAQTHAIKGAFTWDF